MGAVPTRDDIAGNVYATPDAAGRPLDPYSLYDDALPGVLAFGDDHVTDTRQYVLDTVEAVFEDPDDVSAAAWQDRMHADALGRYAETAGAATEQERVQEATVQELVQTLDGLVQSDATPDWYAAAMEAVTAFLRGYRPHRYNPPRRDMHDYTVTVETDPDTLYAVARATNPTRPRDIGSCHFDRPAAFDAYMSDPSVVMTTVAKDGTARGYARGYLAEGETGDALLCIDTVEVTNYEYVVHSEAAKALVLGTVQAGRDLGVDRVLGGTRQWANSTTDGVLREPHGTRDSFIYRKPEMSARYTAARDELPMEYTFTGTPGSWAEESAYVLLDCSPRSRGERAGE